MHQVCTGSTERLNRRSSLSGSFLTARLSQAARDFLAARDFFDSKALGFFYGSAGQRANQGTNAAETGDERSPGSSLLALEIDQDLRVNDLHEPCQLAPNSL
jgi:hypothetical protein